MVRETKRYLTVCFRIHVQARGMAMTQILAHQLFPQVRHAIVRFVNWIHAEMMLKILADDDEPRELDVLSKLIQSPDSA
jgi:hypothetical protein